MAPDPSPRNDAGTPLEPTARRLSPWRRVQLTWRYLGPRTLAYRLVTFPLRLTPLRRRVHRRPGNDVARARSAAWYRRNGRAVTVVIPTYGPPDLVIAAVESVRKTTSRDRVRIVVADDASAPEHVARLRELTGVRLVEGDANVGFAANVNRGLAAADPEHDVVLLNSDVVALPGWLAALQHAASVMGRGIGIVGARLLYLDGRIQHAGVVRNPDAPVWFDHRFRFKLADHGPANIPGDVLAVTGACLYLTRTLLDRIGPLDERYPMAYEDVDWCLRAWEAGFRVFYQPAAVLEHHESATRGTELGEREQVSQDAFWERWGTFFGPRNVTGDAGELRVVYVTEDTGIGGGHRDIFEHLNRLLDRGHDARLFTLGQPPDWFDLRAPVSSFEEYEDLVDALAPLDAIKVATWWHTGPAVWRAAVTHGVPVFFVQDIETSYYPEDETMRHRVLAGYRSEFTYMTISGWNQDRLRELGVQAELIPPGIDLETFRPLAGASRRNDMLLALGRTNPLKNLPLTISAWKALGAPRPELTLFGIEPELGSRHGARYVTEPSDEGVNELFNEATVFVQTSIHEGFCLPPLEAMATGAAVVCTDAHGNRDFCRDGENCLIPEPETAAVSAAIARLLSDPELRARLGEEGTRTAAAYAWEKRIDELEAFYRALAATGAPRSAAPPA